MSGFPSLDIMCFMKRIIASDLNLERFEIIYTRLVWSFDRLFYFPIMLLTDSYRSFIIVSLEFP